MWRTIFCATVLCVVRSAPAEDRVLKQPGLPDTPNFETYAGYLPIPNSQGKELFYVMVQSQNNPATDPVVLWLNGGPGCSSMDGFLYENGPYIFNYEAGEKLRRNQYSWNTNATMVYIDSPAGVGFSVLGSESNINTSDKQTAHDSLQALIQLFRKFPEFSEHEFFISGESYAGIYVPTLAYNILLHNAYTSGAKINLKGIAVGNGVTDWKYDTTPALMKMLWSHSLIWWDLYDTLVKECENFENWDSKGCIEATNYIQAVVLKDINIYDLYGDCIYHNGTHDKEDNVKRLGFLKLGKSLHPGVPPCASWRGAYAYLEDRELTEAFHVSSSAFKWQLCSRVFFI